MVRKLKHHEQRLLRKVDFITYPKEQSVVAHRQSAVARRYNLSRPEDYRTYNRLAGSLRHLAHRIALLPSDSAFRLRYENLLLEKLHDLGLLVIGGGDKGKLSDVERKITVSAFCRRRLGVVTTRLKMAETISSAQQFIERGEVAVGPTVVTDPAFLVTRNMEDFVTWAQGSNIKRTIEKYRDRLDDYDIL